MPRSGQTRRLLPCLLLAGLGPGLAAAQTPALLDAVPPGAEYVFSIASGPFRGTTVWDRQLPGLIGDPDFLSHPDAPALDRVLVAGQLAAFPRWDVLSAEGRFLRSDRVPDRERDLFGRLGRTVRYRDALPALPGLSRFFRFAVVGAPPAQSPASAPYAGDLRSDLVRQLAAGPGPEPSVWLAVRLAPAHALLGRLGLVAGDPSIFDGGVLFVEPVSVAAGRFQATARFSRPGAVEEALPVLDALLRPFLDGVVADASLTVDPVARTLTFPFTVAPSLRTLFVP